MQRQAPKAKELVIPEVEGPLQNPDVIRQLIIPVCVEGNPCHQIFVDDEAGIAVCRAYVNPTAVHCRMGRKNACGIKALPDENAVAAVQGKVRVGQQKQR